jgi:SagB-type dehydrogenase family enzyme
MILALAFIVLLPQGGSAMRMSEPATVVLPRVAPDAGCLEGLLHGRRSVRAFAESGLTIDDAARLLFAGQGVNRPKGLRTVPSAGALYPLELYLVVGDVPPLGPGVYRYRPVEHDLVKTADGDRRKLVAEACLNQLWMADAPAQIVICAVYERVTARYGQRGKQYVHMEAGAASQAIALEAVSLGLGTTFVGAFGDERLQGILGSRSEERPLLVLPVGRAR